jgi:xylan 1,4-beta-xylosidase
MKIHIPGVIIFWFLSIAILIVFFIRCTTSSAVINEKPKQDIFLADPTIFYHNGTYYLYGTGSKDGFLVYTSNDLDSWKGPEGVNNGLALKREDAFGTRGFWAPQVFPYQDKFYMAYTANESIAIAESDSPLGPFTQENKQPLAAPVKQIDPYIFMDDDGKKYLYHVRVADGGNRIYVAEIEHDFSGIKEETLTECITATENWENIENAKWSVSEGPTVLKHNDLYYLIYSSNHYRSKDYAVGYALSNSPYGPWDKYEGSPILRREHVNQNGAGHGDIFTDQDQNMYYVFHTHNSDTTIGPRRTALVKADFIKSKNNIDKLVIDERSFQYLKADMK